MITKEVITIQTIGVQILTEEIFLMAGVSIAEFSPFSAIPKTLPVSQLPDTVLFYLLQFFSEMYNDFVSTASSTSRLLTSSIDTFYSVFPHSTRKINPGEVTLESPQPGLTLEQTGDRPFLFESLTDPYREELLNAYAKQHTEEYEMLRKLTLFTLEQKGMVMITEPMLTTIMKAKYTEYVDWIERFYAEKGFEMFDSKQEETAFMDAKGQQLFHQVEYCVLPGVFEEISPVVMNEVANALSALSLFGMFFDCGNKFDDDDEMMMK